MLSDSFTDLTSSVDVESELESKLSGTFGYGSVKAEYDAEVNSTTKFNSQLNFVVSTMRIERYYSSIREELSPLSDDAFQLLDSQDYIGFFKACGPNYVRSIRRAQEVTAIFKFRSNSAEVANEFASNLKVSDQTDSNGSSRDFSRKSKYSSINKSLEIKILGYGLGLNQEGSSTLVATSLEDYNEAMRFAFKSMTQNKDNANHIGMVYGMEVVPWVDNASFQVASRVIDDDIEIPLPRSLIPRAKTKSGKKFQNNGDVRALFYCKEFFYQIDKYGYCCDPETLYNYVDATYEDEDPDVEKSERICKPVRVLEKSLVRNNMAMNAEFVTRLDSIVRLRLNQLFTLEKCISAVHAIPDQYEYYFLKPQEGVQYTVSSTSLTVAELRMALDPTKDYGLVTNMGRELDEFIDMFYQPCIASLFGSEIGSNPGTDPKYFMAYPWYHYDSCNVLSCLAENMRWGRDGTGCIPSLITGINAPEFSGEDCSYDDDGFEEEESCKFEDAILNKYREGARQCWGNSSFDIVPTYLMDHFCQPTITMNKETDPARLEDLAKRKCSCDPGCGSEAPAPAPYIEGDPVPYSEGDYELSPAEKVVSAETSSSVKYGGEN